MDIQKEVTNTIKEGVVKLLSVEGADLTPEQLLPLLQEDYWYLQDEFVAHIVSRTYEFYKRSVFYTQGSFYHLMEDNFSPDSIFALYSCNNPLEGVQELVGGDEDIMNLLLNEDLLVLHNPGFKDVMDRYYKRYGFSL